MTEFDPRYPPTTNSLNRLKLEASLLPDSIRGKTGYELVSTHALKKLINTRTDDMATFYEQVVIETDWAMDVMRTIGRRLGYLLLTLVRNDRQTHRANPDKAPGFWAYWSTVKTVYLGGGMVRGHGGQILSSEALSTLTSLTGDGGYQVIQADYPQYLPLLGAARTIQTGSQALMLDFGGSFVKRAVARYSEAGLHELQIMDTLRSDLPDEPDDPQIVFARMVDIMVQSCVAADATTIAISIAVYVDENGQPLLSQAGTYMQLARLTADVPAVLSQAVSDKLGKMVQVKLLHDGTAAALRYAPLEHAAVIMIGTALGSGYPVAPNLRLRPIASAFHLIGN